MGLLCTYVYSISTSRYNRRYCKTEIDIKLGEKSPKPRLCTLYSNQVSIINRPCHMGPQNTPACRLFSILLTLSNMKRSVCTKQRLDYSFLSTFCVTNARLLTVYFFIEDIGNLNLYFQQSEVE